MRKQSLFQRWTTLQMSHMRRCLHTKRQLTASLQNPFWWEAFSMSNLLVSLSSSWCIEWSYAHSFRYLPYVNTYTTHHTFFCTRHANFRFISLQRSEWEKSRAKLWYPPWEKFRTHNRMRVDFYLGWTELASREQAKKSCVAAWSVFVTFIFLITSAFYISTPKCKCGFVKQT